MTVLFFNDKAIHSQSSVQKNETLPDLNSKSFARFHPCSLVSCYLRTGRLPPPPPELPLLRGLYEGLLFDGEYVLTGLSLDGFL